VGHLSSAIGALKIAAIECYTVSRSYSDQKLLTPAKEAVTQLASTNMVHDSAITFLAIPAQAGTHASTST
jgi:hypothetical protein